MAKLIRLYVLILTKFIGNYPLNWLCANIWKQESSVISNWDSTESHGTKMFKIGGLVKGFLWLLITINCLFVSAQSFPVQLIPQVSPPPPIYFTQYADASTTNSPLRLQIILNDLEISNREIRLKAYFQGNGISFQSNDVVVGASPLFLEGGIPLVLTNAELAPYFRYENITGISPNVYGQAIPEGAYQFCYEVYDVLTGNRLSQKSCAVSVVFQNEPPFLISPRNKTLVAENNPQNIIFQWTPRSINVSNVEYELSLVEIWDTQIDPQAAFLSSPPIFQTITTSTTYVYGPADPLLLSGKNYAWRIQAKAKQGAEEIGLFKNQGYSEIFSFSYAGSCDLPFGINHEVKGSTNANIYWDDFTTDVPEYSIRYRQKGNTNEWFLSKTNTNQLTLWDLKADTTYEYQLQKKCVVTGSDWSMAKQFTTFLADNEASVYQCGITPNFSLTNKEPLPKLSTGESFVAGDFPIHVLEVSGSKGRFTGKGYVTIPYLNNIKVGVEFTNVQINTDKQMSEGTVITVYDPNLASILDVDEAIDTVTNVVDALAGFFDALRELLKDYKGTDEEQEQLEEYIEELNEEIDSATSDLEISPKLKEELEFLKEEINENTGELLAQGSNPNISTVGALDNTVRETSAALNEYENISESKPDGEQSIAGDYYFDGTIKFSTPEPIISATSVEGQLISSNIGEITNPRADSVDAKIINIRDNKKLYVSNNSVSYQSIDNIKTAFANVDSSEYLLWIHYDFGSNEVKYKVAFGDDYYQDTNINKDELVDLYNNVLQFNLKEFIGSAILEVTERFDGLLNEYKDQLPIIGKDVIGDLSIYEVLKIAINFTRNCAVSFQAQESGIVPRCIWYQNVNIPIAYYAGFIDAAWEIGELVVDIVKLKNAWDPLSSFFSTPEALEIRQQTMDALVMLQNLWENKNGEQDRAWESINREVDKYLNETIALDAQARYNQGKLIFEVASAFFGIAEIKAFAKTGKVTSNLLSGFAKIPYFFDDLLKMSPKLFKNGIRFIKEGKTLRYVIESVDGTQIAKFSDKGILEVIQWDDVGGELILKIEKIKIRNPFTKSIDEFDVEIVNSRSGGKAFKLSFKEGFQHSADDVNEFFIKVRDDAPPYKSGTLVEDLTLQPGEKFFIVENQKQSFFGGWASKQQCKNIEELRERFAVLESWKNSTPENPLVVREYQIVKPLRVRSGTIGKQDIYNGGAHQYELVDDLNYNNSNDFLLQVGQDIPLN